MEAHSQLKEFLADSICLILEPSQTFAASIQACLHGMGIPINQIQLCRRFADGKKFTEEKKPRLIVTEYEIDQHFGMELAEIQERLYEDTQRISFITTKNSSASAIAEAAEGQIDGYLLKPFAIESFRQKLMDIVRRKLNPSEYSKKITLGKSLLYRHDLDKAIEAFLAAKTLAPKPALACFYAGSTFHTQGNIKRALAEYKEGRQYQPLHYKCLIGEFEGHIAEKNYQAAYALMEPIFKNYPITSRRLGQMFVASVFTGNFSELPVLYDLFSRLDQKTPDLIEISSVAVLTAGKYFIRKKDYVRAAEYFDIGVNITRRNFQYIERIVAEFIQANAHEQAQYFLDRVSDEDTIKADYDRLRLRVDEMVLTREEIAERARKMVLSGKGTPEIFELSVKAMAQLGKETLAEAIIGKAMETHPELRQSLYKLLNDNLPAGLRRSL